MGGYEVVFASDPADTHIQKFVTAKCPVGKTVIGGGAGAVGDVTGAHLWTSHPYFDQDGTLLRPNEWVAGADSVDSSKSWGLEAEAICASIPGNP
jgi:hypothetical protein